MRVALDTNRCTDFIAGESALTRFLEGVERLFLPFICIGELRAGFVGGNRGPENEQKLIKLLERTGVSILFADEQTTHHYARLYMQLRRQGTPIPTNDIWIAALVAQHDLTLCTRDKHFDYLPQIPRV